MGSGTLIALACLALGWHLRAGAAESLIANGTGKTIISRANHDMRFQTSYMIISTQGTVIVADPYQVAEGIQADVITSSHKDFDHNDASFYERSQARKSLHAVETFTVKDVTVTGIASTHSAGEIDPLKPTNVIYVYEVDGLRIAHMGDICQPRLTDVQLKALGKIDIVFLMMEHQPTYGFSKENTLAILDQLKPALALPTHPDWTTLEAVKRVVTQTREETFRLVTSREDLDATKTTLVVLRDGP